MFSLFQELSYNSLRGGVSVLTSKGDTSVSSLILQNLDKEDAGTYECQADTVKPAFINVHVLNGDPSCLPLLLYICLVLQERSPPRWRPGRAPASSCLSRHSAPSQWSFSFLAF